MPCDYIDAATLAEQKRLEEEREKEIALIEALLEAGIATIVQAESGAFQLMNAQLPAGMFDACVLAELEKRNSQGFQAAMSQSQTQESFVVLHDRSHNK
ncbi:MAG: hypothetical protein KAS32_19570 [Candidatus Peribacteraceae bacterium]|nr:hypothetical protein [Candidatus Peribacteraceae bacterium]